MPKDGPPQLRVPRFTGAPRFVTRAQFAAHHGTRGEVTRDMDDYTRRAQSMRMTQADGDGTEGDGTEEDAKDGKQGE